MSKFLTKLLTQLVLVVGFVGLTATTSFAGNPSKVYVSLHNGGAFSLGLFYKKVEDKKFQMVGNWILLGDSRMTPEIPKRGSTFCISINAIANYSYYNYYFNVTGDAPDWFEGSIGNANIDFSGSLFNPSWGFNGAQSAGLEFYQYRNERSACGT